VSSKAVSDPAIAAAHPIYCKFLVNRSSYQACHVRLPDLPLRQPAIAVDGQFYSFFRALPVARKALIIAARLGKREDHVAITLTGRGYALWVHEPLASLAPPRQVSDRELEPVFGPVPCLLLNNAAGYRRCCLQVPDLEQPIEGLVVGNRGYSIFRQVSDAVEAIALTARLTAMAEETVLVVMADSLLVAVFEANAVEI
jgi:hypothetical protein